MMKFLFAFFVGGFLGYWAANEGLFKDEWRQLENAVGARNLKVWHAPAPSTGFQRDMELLRLENARRREEQQRRNRQDECRQRLAVGWSC